MRPIIFILVLALLGAGCLGAEDPGSSPEEPDQPPVAQGLGFGSPVTALSACTFTCYEPTVAVDEEGRIFVAEGAGEGLVRSTDGGATFQALGAPEVDGLPQPTLQADNLVQIGPDGSLYFSALLLDRSTGIGAPVILGVQVARSDDGGASWATNTVLSLPTDPGAGTIEPDRQWLGFGQDGVVYLSYSQIPTGLYVHRSEDRGESWGPATPVVTVAQRGNIGQAGLPIVDSQGTVYLPFSTNFAASGEGDQVRAVDIAVSEDGGVTWSHRTALTAPNAGNWFPMLTVDAQDRLHLAAHSGNGLLVTTGTEQARSWSQPEAWTQEDPAVAPWIDIVAGNLTVAYHAADGDEVSLHVASRPLDAAPGTGPSDHVEVVTGLPSADTDFTHLTNGPTGPWIVWSHSEDDVIHLAGPPR